MSWSACKTQVRIVSQDQQEIRLQKGQPAPDDGWFLNDARYQRYRRAVADRILESQTNPVNPGVQTSGR